MPDDHTFATYTTWAQEFTFQVVMIDPCKTSILNDFVVEDMSRSVKQMPSSQKLVKPQDSVSQSYGNLDGFTYCGPREFQITTEPSSIYSNFLNLDSTFDTFTYGSNLQSDVGVYDLKMRVYLLNYPDVELEKTFKVEIIWC